MLSFSFFVCFTKLLSVCFPFRLPYVGYIGGVISFTATSYRRINGFSNLYFGWGGEDDDLRQRYLITL